MKTTNLSRSLLTAVAVLGLITGLPLSAKNDEAPTRPGSYEDWNDGMINKLVIKESFKTSDFAEVRVAPVETATTPLPDKDDNTYEPAVNVLKQARSYLMEGMKEELKSPPVTEGDMPPPAPPAASAPASGASATAPARPRVLVLRVRVIKLDPGSRAARFWVGFGSGKSNVELAGELLDGDSGKVLLTFNLTRASSGGGKVAGGKYEKMMGGDIWDAGSDIGQMLALFK